jgi:hypothetical protein
MRDDDLAREISWATLVVSTMLLTMLAPTVYWLIKNASPAVADFAEVMILFGVVFVLFHTVRHFGEYLGPDLYENVSSVIERLRGDYG